MNDDKFDDLLRRYLDDSINELDLEVFLNYVATLDKDVIIQKIDLVLEGDDTEQVTKLIQIKSNKKRTRRVKMYAVAASLTLFIAIGLFLGRDLFVDRGNLNTSAARDILMPDSEILVRSSNGQVKLLDKKDTLYRLGALEISVDDVGQISYALKNELAKLNEEITIHIPKGKTSFLKMSDSSKVWLNSNSEISFKAHFEKEKRIVSLSGEAYFEVEHDDNRPFIIHTESHDIEVLGTAFNVSSYSGMAAKTTLLNGSVRIKHESKESILKPFQQFLVTTDGQTRVVKVDAFETLAWRDGHFVFDKMNLKDILVYLSNWYPIQDIKVERWTEDTFTGTFRQERSLKNILDKLAKTSSYEFQIHDGTLEISVTP